MYIQLVFTCKVGIEYVVYIVLTYPLTYLVNPIHICWVYCFSLPLLCRWISCKEIDLTSIERMRIRAIEIVRMIENTFPIGIWTIHVHTLVHMVDEVAMGGVVNT